jgi:hypothetical protein
MAVTSAGFDAEPASLAVSVTVPPSEVYIPFPEDLRPSA